MQTKDGLIINITIHGWVLALVGLIVFLAVIAFSSSVARGAGQPATADEAGRASTNLAAPALAGLEGRRFYVTSNKSYLGSQVLTACAAGYHTASLWELYDVSNLAYAYDHPNAATWPDSGFGPPSAWSGWVRTGYLGHTTNAAGRANCQNWTSASASNYGTVIKLTDEWDTSPGTMGPWQVTTQACSIRLFVWCVED